MFKFPASAGDKIDSNLMIIDLSSSVDVAWSVESCLQPGGPGSIPAGSRILISVLGLGVSFVFCRVLSPEEALTLS